MGHERRLAGRFQHDADEGKMVAVALRAEMLDRRAHVVAQVGVGIDPLGDLFRRADLLAARPPARSEMRHRMNGVE